MVERLRFGGVVAVDGPGGVGKSTVSRSVAARLGLAHLDTGAMYRAATLAILRAGVRPTDADAVVAVVTAGRLTYEMGAIWLDGDEVTLAIRSAEVTAAVSDVSAIAAVRHHLVGLQRVWVAAHGGSAVIEGRDIGTVVFPDARVKVFLDARPEVRAARRAAETAGSSTADIAADLARRDRIDSSRTISPLRPADDAHVIDTSDRGVDEVVEAVLALIAAATVEP